MEGSGMANTSRAASLVNGFKWAPVFPPSANICLVYADTAPLTSSRQAFHVQYSTLLVIGSICCLHACFKVWPWLYLVAVLGHWKYLTVLTKDFYKMFHFRKKKKKKPWGRIIKLKQNLLFCLPWQHFWQLWWIEMPLTVTQGRHQWEVSTV